MSELNRHYPSKQNIDTTQTSFEGRKLEEEIFANEKLLHEINNKFTIGICNVDYIRGAIISILERKVQIFLKSLRRLLLMKYPLIQLDMSRKFPMISLNLYSLKILSYNKNRY